MKVERDKSVPPKPTPRKSPAPPNSHMAVEHTTAKELIGFDATPAAATRDQK